MRFFVARVLGQVLRAGIALILLVRRPRPIHSHGIVFDGQLVLLDGRATSGIGWIDRRHGDAVPVVARVSRGAGLPTWLPDVTGLGVRWQHEGKDVDLELSSTGIGFPGRFLLLPRLSASRATLSSILPYRTARGPVLLCARTVPPRRLPAPLSALRRSVVEEPWQLRLYFASARGRWHPFAELRLSAPRGDDARLRLDTDRNGLPGAESYGWALALRQPSYRLAQRPPRGGPDDSASSRNAQAPCDETAPPRTLAGAASPGSAKSTSIQPPSERDDMESTPFSTDGSADSVQPLRDGDATAVGDPSDDPAQVEWDRTEALDAGADEADLDPATATGADPDEIPSDDDEVPAQDQPRSTLQPESQGEDPLIADLGEEGEGDLSPNDA